MADGLAGIEDVIREAVEKWSLTHAQISARLRTAYPSLRGLSAASVKRFCLSKNIHRTARLDQSTLDRLVHLNVMRVGPMYGRKTMTGLLSSQGFRCAQNRVGESLSRVNPDYHRERSVLTQRQINPTPYIARYFGEKLHVDQNEKLVAFGVTHVCAVDGFSGKIMVICSMPVKNNIIIYEHVFLKLVEETGLWNQIRIDHGREWYLMLFAQQHLSSYRNDTSKPPFVQTTSKKKESGLRLTPRAFYVNYPIKRILLEMEEAGEISMDNPIHKFCTSWFTLQVAGVGLTLLMSSWNEHPIPGRRHGLPQGVPNQRVLIDNRVKHVTQSLLWSPTQAANLYRQSGGNITDPAGFGIDPLLSDQHKSLIRSQAFKDKVPSFEPVFHTLVNGDNRLFREGLMFLCSVTYRLSCS